MNMPSLNMRPWVLVSMLLMWGANMDAQLLISTGGTVTGCDNALTDAGGPAGSYGANENYTITLCPEAPDTTIWLEWTIFDLDGNSTITIYDGDSDQADELAQGSNSQLDGLVVVASESNPTGCLTINFQSGANSSGDFVAGINCGQPCAVPVPVVNENESNPFRTCPGQEVVYDGTGSYPTGDADIVLWQWDWDGDGTVDEETTEGEAAHVYDDAGIYRLQMHVKDGNDCESVALTNYIVQVSTDPVWTTDPLVYTACTGVPLEIEMAVEGVNYTLEPEVDFGGGLFIPDEPGQCFTSELTFNSFIPGETMADASEAIDNFFINFEHSYMGDLTVTFICPNGQSIMVHQQGGGGTFLGVPVDNDGDPNTPGQGFDYFWEPDATNGTWVDNASFGTLPSGAYESVQPFSNLNGCPLNGVWQMEICDFFGSDNGFVFDWAIEFADSLYPEEQSFTPQFSLDCDSAFWTYNFEGDDMEVDCPSLDLTYGAPSLQTVTAHAINDFGCEYTQDLTVKFVDFTPTLTSNPERYCGGYPVTLQAGVNPAEGATGATYSWDIPGDFLIDVLDVIDTSSIVVGGMDQPEVFEVIIEQTFDFPDFPGVTCVSQATIGIETCEIVIPNVITPFGTANQNDKFRVEGISAYEDVQLKIMNRWGTTIFLDDNFETSEGWDPAAENASAGIYYYILTIPVDEGPLVVTDIQGAEQEFEGEGPFVFQGEIHLLK